MDKEFLTELKESEKGLRYIDLFVKFIFSVVLFCLAFDGIDFVCRINIRTEN